MHLAFWLETAGTALMTLAFLVQRTVNRRTRETVEVWRALATMWERAAITYQRAYLQEVSRRLTIEERRHGRSD